jgi:N-acetylmuramoyl-L-alanine amidase
MLLAIIVAACLMAEAEGEGMKGVDAVADTIANRMELRGLTAGEVVSEKGQYASLDAHQIRIRSARSPAAWAYCLEVASKLVHGKWIVTSPWTHFYAPARCKAPAWADKMTDEGTVGNHVFGRLET